MAADQSIAAGERDEPACEIVGEMILDDKLLDARTDQPFDEIIADRSVVARRMKDGNPRT